MALVIAGLILLSPIVALLAVIAAEMLIDGLMEAGVTGVSAIAIGAVGWVQFRRISRSDSTAIRVEGAVRGTSNRRSTGVRGLGIS